MLFLIVLGAHRFLSARGGRKIASRLLTFLGKRLSTCAQILMLQKAFLQTSMSYDLISVIKLLHFC